MTIAIIGALAEEISAVKAALQHCTEEKIGPLAVSVGEINGHKIALFCSGIGKSHAAMTATLALHHYRPSCVINIGTLGGLHTHLAPRSIILAESVLYHDVDVTGFGYTHGQVPQMPADFRASEALLTLFEQLANQLNLTFYTGLAVTGDQFISSGDLIASLKQKFPKALGIDMEAAAIAHVCHVFATPFISVRAISDHADEDAAKMFDHHVASASENVAKLVTSAVGQVSEVLKQ